MRPSNDQLYGFTASDIGEQIKWSIALHRYVIENPNSSELETEFFLSIYIVLQLLPTTRLPHTKSSLCFAAVTVGVIRLPNIYLWSVGEPDYCRGGGGTVRVTRLDPLADLEIFLSQLVRRMKSSDLERPCCPLLSSNTLALILGVMSGRNELMVV